MTTETPESLQEIERLIKRYKASPDLWDEALMFIEVMSAITRVVKERDMLEKALRESHCECVLSPRSGCLRCAALSTAEV